MYGTIYNEMTQNFQCEQSVIYRQSDIYRYKELHCEIFFFK